MFFVLQKENISDFPAFVELGKELGDVLWNLSQLATELDLSLDEIAINNLRKLKSRKDRNKLHGNGDNR